MEALEDFNCSDTQGAEHPKRRRLSMRYSLAPSSPHSQQLLHPSAAAVVGVGEDPQPIPLHDPLVAELGSGELALPDQALHRLGVNVQNLGGLDDIDVILKYGPNLVRLLHCRSMLQKGSVAPATGAVIDGGNGGVPD